MSAAHLTRLLADDDRRRVVAALVLGAERMADIRRMTDLSVRRVVVATGRLVDGGLVEEIGDGRFLILEAAFALAARDTAPEPGADEHRGLPPERARVLRAHVRDGRLTSIPTSHAKRLIVLDLIVQDFDLDTHYSERQVNALLGKWHPDTAALRRWLVDVGYLDRDHGDYWRCGGPVDV